MFLEERKCFIKKRTSKFITDDIEVSSDDSDKNYFYNSGKENSDEESSHEEN